MIDICESSPAYVRAIAPYPPGKPISELAREYSLEESSIIKLASNENPLGYSPRARAAIDRELPDLFRYPDGNAFDLRSALSAHYGLPMESIVVGNGSNDLLEIVASAFLAPGRAAVYSEHAFAVYPLATQARGATSIVVPAKNFGHDLDAMRKAVTPETRVVFIANPNNPTGTFASGAEVERLVAGVPGNVVVVLDEAYTDYLPADKRYDSLAWLGKYRNLVVTRTFSKVYGLAGLRVGFAVCDPEVAGLLHRVRQPFNVNNLALVAAIASLGDREFVARSAAMNLAGMGQLEGGFRALGLEFIPSVGNFVSVAFKRKDGQPQAAAVFERLLRRGVIVRPVSGYGMPDHLRITVGTREENERFLEALAKSI